MCVFMLITSHTAAAAHSLHFNRFIPEVVCVQVSSESHTETQLQLVQSQFQKIIH